MYIQGLTLALAIASIRIATRTDLVEYRPYGAQTMKRAYVSSDGYYLCGDCGDLTLTNQPTLPSTSTLELTDMDYVESDCPEACDACGQFLENRLTDDGIAYVATMAIANAYAHNSASGNGRVLREWIRFYRHIPAIAPHAEALELDY